MPTISIFYGIAIRMFLADHSPPHFHAIYGEFEATFSIETGKLLKGKFPKTATNLVQEWTAINRNALIEDWQLAQQNKLPNPIGGLDAE
jgi:Domain of unknown function (DUF4160)